jgi:adenosylcobinamide-phosphate synthase
MFTLLIAYFLEAIFGYPKFIYAKIKHPVVWMGAVISWLERNCNKSHTSRVTGIFTMATLLAITLAITLPIQKFGNIYIEAILMATLLATRSLYDHVNAVYTSLRQNNLQTARLELAKIVGRDTENLDESEICKAAIESLAESFSDGVVAPVFWAALFGLPAIACYKAINTADSMIGHKTERYKYFGWAAARLDDAANFIPARLSALLIIAVYPLSLWGRVREEAKKHASPNSGYPEAAMAYALGICLGGKRSYDGEEYSAPLIGDGLRTEITIKDLQKALRIYVSACTTLGLILLTLATALY